MAYPANPLPAALASHLGLSLSSSYSTANPIPCLWPGKAMDDGSGPLASARMLETRKKLPAFVLDQLSPGHYDHLASEAADGSCCFQSHSSTLLSMCQFNTISNTLCS